LALRRTLLLLLLRSPFETVASVTTGRLGLRRTLLLPLLRAPFEAVASVTTGRLGLRHTLYVYLGFFYRLFFGQ
jgi:hypothetical protein